MKKWSQLSKEDRAGLAMCAVFAVCVLLAVGRVLLELALR